MSYPPGDDRNTRSSGYRQKRRAVERVRRRRRLARRLGAAGVVLLVVAVVYAVAAGLDSGEGDGQTAERSGEAGEPGLVMVRLTDGDTVPVVVAVGSDTSPTYILGLPADTLLEGPEGFDPLSELLATHELDELSFETLLGGNPTAAVTLQWDELRGLLPERGEEGGEGWPEDLDGSPSSAETAAQSLAALVEVLDQDGSDLDDLSSGEVGPLRDTLEALSPAPAVTGGLPGSTVEGVGYTYYEPDLAGLQRLLGREQTTATVEVEVQNGSGVVGVAQRVTDAVEPLGFTMLPPKNAEQFPNVENSRILAAPNVLAEADRVREVLGVGQVVPRDDLPAGRIVVVVGKDLPVESLPEG